MNGLECRRFLGRLCDYLDGAANAQAARKFESHLLACPRCACVFRTVRKTIDLYRRSDPPPIQAEVRERVWFAVLRPLGKRFPSR
jgi:anti-sigma factor RsiW